MSKKLYDELGFPIRKSGFAEKMARAAFQGPWPIYKKPHKAAKEDPYWNIYKYNLPNPKK